MIAPTRDASTTTSSIVINWAAQSTPDNGYLPIISYNLQWDRGTNNQVWYNLIGISNNTLVTTYSTVD